MNKRKQLLQNIQSVAQDDIAIISGVISFGIVLYLGLIFSNLEQNIGNMGSMLAYTQIVSHRVLSVLFGLFIAATIYKIRRTNQRSNAKTSSGLFGGLFSAIIIGCPACSISIASYIGLGTFLFNMPGFGVELKLLGLLVLAWATWTTVRDLYVCKINK